MTIESSILATPILAQLCNQYEVPSCYTTVYLSKNISTLFLGHPLLIFMSTLETNIHFINRYRLAGMNTICYYPYHVLKQWV